MARIMLAVTSLLVLVCLCPSPPVSAFSIGEVLSSAAGALLPKRASDEAISEVKNEEETDESTVEEVEALPQVGQQSKHLEPIPTVYTTRTEYIKVTSTKTQIPMCVTAYIPLPECSNEPYDPLHPYESLRTEGRTNSNDVLPEAGALEAEKKISEENLEINSKRTGRFKSHLLSPLTWPLEKIGLLPSSKSTPQYHIHFDVSPAKNPLDPNHPLHPANPLHGANLVNLITGGLAAGVGLADVLANAGLGLTPGLGLNAGLGLGLGLGLPLPAGTGSGFYNGAYVEVVREVSTITSYVTKTAGSHTATLTAGHCMPASDTIPHCTPTATYNGYLGYDPYYHQEVYVGVPNYPLSRGAEGASLLDSAISPSTSSVVPESASQITPPL